MKMSPDVYVYISDVLKILRAEFLTNAVKVHTGTWQGIDISKKPEMAMHELMNVTFAFEMGNRSPEILGKATGANMPWAEDHFQERVCGQPINPGREWKNWPFGHSAEKFLDAFGKFNHNYMERYWPKYAGQVDDATFTAEDHTRQAYLQGRNAATHKGIYHSYGDLADVVDLLNRDPLTRQAYLPVFFPEDTGAVHGDRVPCTLGYHFMVRNDQLHCWYYLRSCDYIRHFADDIYLSVRLAQWVLEQLKELDREKWSHVKAGTFTMHIASLHCFANDWIKLNEQNNP